MTEKGLVRVKPSAVRPGPERIVYGALQVWAQGGPWPTISDLVRQTGLEPKRVRELLELFQANAPKVADQVRTAGHVWETHFERGRARAARWEAQKTQRTR